MKQLNRKRKIATCVLCVLILFSSVPVHAEEVNAAAKDVYALTGDYLESLGTPAVGSIGGEWMVLGLARSGRTVPSDYYGRVETYVLEQIDENGRLHKSKSTENSRIILALTAAGYDPENVAGYNLLEGLTDLDYVKKQGINGPIWALIAIDSYGYTVETEDAMNPVTRTKLIETILNAQLADYGWTLSGDIADVDMTGMAIQALAPYYEENSNVKNAVDAALIFLSEKQEADGSFGSVDGNCTESCAQVIVALTALGIDPDKDERFIKNDNSVVDALCAYAIEDGGFRHTEDGERDGMATEQGYYALTAYMRLMNGESSLYDMDETIESNPQIPSEDDQEEEETTTEKEDGAVTTVKSLIQAIGTVNANSGIKIKSARTAYDKLTEEQKKQVNNYGKLIAAEEAYPDARASQVETLIDAIGAVSVNSESKIIKARVAYDNLSETEQSLVENYEYLRYAEYALDEARVANVEDLIDSIGTISESSRSKISRARTAFNNLEDSRKDWVSNLNILLEAEDAYAKLGSTPAKKTTVKTSVESESKEKVEQTPEAITGDTKTFADQVKEQMKDITKVSWLGEMVEVILAYEDLTEEEKLSMDRDWMIGNLKIRVAEELQTDAQKGIAVSGVEWDVRLVVEDVTDITQIQDLQKKLGENTVLGIWNIHLEDFVSGKEIKPDESVMIRIPLNLLGDSSRFDGLAVVHITEEETVEYLNCMQLGDGIVFNAADFSYYMVVGYNGISPLEQLEMSGNFEDGAVSEHAWLPWTLMGVCGIVVLVVLYLLITNNKKAKIGE